MSGFCQMGKELARDRRGATAIEYGFLVALIGLGLMTVFSVIGDSLTAIFSDTNKGFSEVANNLNRANGNGDNDCGTGKGGSGSICKK